MAFVPFPGISENFHPNHFFTLVDFVVSDCNQKIRLSSRKSLTYLKLEVCSCKILHLKVCMLF